jgi:modification methylase
MCSSVSIRGYPRAREPSCEACLEDMQSAWGQCDRVLRPDGRLCINAPIIPIPKALIEQHTRHLKNIAFDMEQRIQAVADRAA